MEVHEFVLSGTSGAMDPWVTLGAGGGGRALSPPDMVAIRAAICASFSGGGAHFVEYRLPAQLQVDLGAQYICTSLCQPLVVQERFADLFKGMGSLTHSSLFSLESITACTPKEETTVRFADCGWWSRSGKSVRH